MASTASSSALVVGASAVPARRPVHFRSLPEETQKEIFRQCRTCDLVCLAVVCRHFRDLAAEQLYHNMHVVFRNEPDSDDVTCAMPMFLDTFATSEYDYVQYMREFTFDTEAVGLLGQSAYSSLSSDRCPGRLLNSVLVLSMRKARKLESFVWNVRIEMSRPLYKALHNIDTLTNVSIRYQVGPSKYEPIRELPIKIASTDEASSRIQSAPSTQSSPSTVSGFKKLKSLSVLDIESLDVIQEIRTCIQNCAGTLNELRISISSDFAHKSPRSLLGSLDSDSDSDVNDPFGLIFPASTQSTVIKPQGRREREDSQESVLAKILDVEKPRAEDDLASDPTYRELLAAIDNEYDGDSSKEANRPDWEANFSNILRTLIATLSSLGETNYADVEEKRQKVLASLDAVLGRYDGRKPGNARSDRDSPAEAVAPGSSKPTSGSSDVDIKLDDSPTLGPLPSLPEASSFLGTTPSAPKKPKARRGRDVDPEDIDVEAPEETQLLLDPQGDPSDSELDVDGLDESDTDVPTPKAVPAENQSIFAGPDTVNGFAETAAQSDSTGADAMDNSSKLAEVLGMQLKLLGAMQDSLRNSARAATVEPKNSKKTSGAKDAKALEMAPTSSEELLPSMKVDVAALKKSLSSLQSEVQKWQARIASSASSPRVGAAPADTSTMEAERRRVTDYARSTRGLALQSLALKNIVVKPSVLSKAIDLRLLESLTLLRVGPQAPIWTWLARENKAQPLALRSISTDNVCDAFLKCASQLQELHCLYLSSLFLSEHESSQGKGIGSPKTTATISDIYKWILRKHAPTLRVLSVHNQDSSDWDLDDATVKLLSRRARKLEELAAAMGVRAMHMFLQVIGGFTSLVALHIVQLRSDDTCVWVIQETKNFLLDAVAHYPQLGLEFLAIGRVGTADQIVRVDTRKSLLEKQEEKTVATANKGKGKGKGKAKSINESALVGYSGSSSSSSSSSGSSSDSLDTVATADSQDDDLDVVLDDNDNDDDDAYSDSDPTGLWTDIQIVCMPMFQIGYISIFRKEVVNAPL